MKRRFFHELFKWALYPFHLRIKSGPLKGYKWIPSSGSKFIKGTYEPEKTEALGRVLRQGDIAFDVGAHVGYFSILMSKIIGSSGCIYSFEPRGINLSFLERHIKINNCTNIKVINSAVGSSNGKALLETRTGTGTGRISLSGNISVNIISLDAFCSQNISPTFIKIDVEGGEYDVLIGAAKTIDKYKPRIVLATHGPELDEQCISWLTGKGYVTYAVNQPKGDKENVFIHPDNK